MHSWAIKIGGSLYESGYLKKWLDSIAKHSNRKIVLIPGGGPFADQVRAADKVFDLDQKKAHLMAVLAMQQYGTMLSSICPSMQLANSKQKIENAWVDRKIVVWEPFEMVRDECTLVASWAHTSDSIAAWFASSMQIDHLLLVKSADKAIDIKDLSVLAEHECVDKKLPGLISDYNLSTHVLHKSQFSEFESLINH